MSSGGELSQVLSLTLPFRFLLQGKEKYKFPNPNPFVEDDMDKNEVASVAYRYVDLSDAQVWQGGRMSGLYRGKMS